MLSTILLFVVVLLMHLIATTLALLGQINIVYFKTCFWFSGFIYFFSILPAMLTN